MTRKADLGPPCLLSFGVVAARALCITRAFLMSASTSHAEDAVTPSPVFSNLDLTRLVADHQMLRRIGVGAYGEVWLGGRAPGGLRGVEGGVGGGVGYD